MKRFDRSRGGQAAPWAALFAVLLVPIGLLAGASPSHHAGAVAQSTPITVTGTGENKWAPSSVAVGVGDTIVWVVGKNGHSVQFNDAQACKTAEASMTFTPKLTGCKSAIKSKAGEVIVKATVTTALTAALPYRCGVHGNSMSGTITPK
jgi:plastocyanin